MTFRVLPCRPFICGIESLSCFDPKQERKGFSQIILSHSLRTTAAMPVLPFDPNSYANSPAVPLNYSYENRMLLV
jgi:hypothetical protein